MGTERHRKLKKSPVSRGTIERPSRLQHIPGKGLHAPALAMPLHAGLGMVWPVSRKDLENHREEMARQGSSFLQPKGRLLSRGHLPLPPSILSQHTVSWSWEQSARSGGTVVPEGRDPAPSPLKEPHHTEGRKPNSDS